MVIDSAIPPLFLQPLDETAQLSGRRDGSSEVTLTAHTIFYVGPEILGLTNLLMTHSGCTVCYPTQSYEILFEPV